MKNDLEWPIWGRHETAWGSMDAEFNFASIEYDPLNCDAKSLSSVVNAIADGKLYGVKSVEVTHISPATSSSLE